jgi:hypothetical protein
MEMMIMEAWLAPMWTAALMTGGGVDSLLTTENFVRLMEGRNREVGTNEDSCGEV